VRRALIIILLVAACVIAHAQQTTTPARPSWLQEEIQTYKGIAEDARRNSSDAMAATREAMYFCMFVTLAFIGFGFYTLNRLNRPQPVTDSPNTPDISDVLRRELSSAKTELNQSIEQVRQVTNHAYRFLGDLLFNQAHSANEITSLFLLLTALDAYHLGGAEEPREKALVYLKQFNTPTFTSTLDSYNVAWSPGDEELIERTLTWVNDKELRVFLMFMREFVHSRLATQTQRKELLKDGVLVQLEEPKAKVPG